MCLGECGYVTGPERYAKDTALRLTLREMQRDIRNPSHWIAILAVGCVLGIIGPFETGRFMAMVPRIAYWIAVAILTFWSGSFVAGWVTVQSAAYIHATSSMFPLSAMARGRGAKHRDQRSGQAGRRSTR